MEDSGEELVMPLSPMGQCFESSSLSMHVIVVLEFDVPIHNMQFIPLFRDAFISIPRFTSIMVGDKKGVKGWKQVEVEWEDHIIEHKLNDGMSLDSYDKHFANYLSRIGTEKLSESKPLWEIHVIKYPTSKAAGGTLILKFHHAIGDGYTLMGLLLSTLKRADNPSLPLTFPSLKPSKSTHSKIFFLERMSNIFSTAINSVSEFGWSYLKSNFIEDDKTPIRSGLTGVESQPIKTSDVTFSIDHLKEIKSNLRVTLNDVITGIIFYGIRLYNEDIDCKTRTLESTALVIANMRNVQDYKGVQDMLKSSTETRVWGNNVIYLHVSMPKLKDTPISDPLEFVRKTHTSINKKKNSFGSFFTIMYLLLKNKFEGHEEMAKVLHSTFQRSSLVISNIIGPHEQMSLSNHPIKGFFFMVPRVPLSLRVTVMSYMGMLRVTLITEDGFIDEQKLVRYMNKAYEAIRREAAKLSVSK